MEQTNPTNTDLSFSADDFTQEEISQATSGEPNAEDGVITQKNATPEMHKIKYNGKEEEYKYEDLVALAQKGRNYDHVIGERDALKNSEEMKMLSEMAKQAGKKDGKEFLKEMQDNLTALKIEKRAKELEADGMKPEHAKRMAELEVSQPIKEVDETVTDQEPNQFVNDFKQLLENFPETQQYKDISEFPEEFRALMDSGLSPLVAYTKMMLGEKQKKEQIEKQNSDAKKKATNSLKSDQADGKEDSFLSGLNS